MTIEEKEDFTPSKRKSRTREVFERLLKNRSAVVGGVILLVLVFTAVFADRIAPYSTSKQNLRNALAAPSREHFMGTDDLGRDIFSRIVWGARISLQVGLISVSIAMLGGLMLGAVAGYYGGRLDNAIMRAIDVFLAIPSLLFAIAIVSALGPGLRNVMIAVGLGSVPGYARIVRASVLTLRDQEFVEAARSIGATDGRIILRHILPNALAPLIVQATLGVAHAILSAASLSFIGLGIQPPEPEWGAMLSSARSVIRQAWFVPTFPGVMIMITILSLNLLGDGLRDAFDPRLKRGGR